WEITDHPENAYSRRFAPGTPDFDAIHHEVWDDNHLGNAIPGATPKARIDIQTLVAGIPLVMRAGQPILVQARVHNLSERPIVADASYGRRLVRLGGQLCTEDGMLINRDFARASLPSSIGCGGSVDLALQLPALSTPGQYVIKF